MVLNVAEQEETTQDQWIKDFLVTWINRFSFFLAHHLTRPLLPLYLQNLRGLSALDTGLILMPQGLAVAFAGPMAGRLARRWCRF